MRDSNSVNRTIRGSLIAVSLLMLLAPATAAAQTAKDKRMKWWRDANFGMFIHWGLYAVPAGEWKGKEIPGIGEWIMNRAKIPVSEYELLARQFNPVKFNADEWVSIAKRAGMKYITITSKHHDGFAMYHSKASPYNIVDATPFKRDPMKELAEACRKHGIRLCFYYSHAQDWHHPDAAGNDWDFPDESKKNFASYLEEKVRPQVREILTQYGPIGQVWFDTPRTITKEQSFELVKFVHGMQPECIVSGRVGHGAGDYRQLGDNQIPGGVLEEDWEVPATMNDTWGFKVNDHNWKSVRTLTRQLVDIVSKNGNFLLNVGPTAEGVIPRESVERLLAMGRWLDVNGDAIYGASPSPYPSEFEWGAITTKPGKVFLHVYFWPENELVLYGLKNRVRKAYLPADKSATLKVTQEHDAKADHYTLRIGVPSKPPDENVSVIVLEVDGKPEAQPEIMQQPDGHVRLDAFRAQVHGSGGQPQLGFDPRGIVERWFDTNEWLSWDLKLLRPGKFEVSLVTTTRKYASRPQDGNWESGHSVKVRIDDQEISGIVDNDGEAIDLKNAYWIDVTSKIGIVTLSGPGKLRLELRPQSIRTTYKQGLTLRSARLTPVS